MLNDFPYRARAMFAFEEQDGVDVCFFGMHVQVDIYGKMYTVVMNNCSLCRSMVASVPSLTPGGFMSLTWTRSISLNRDTSEQQSITRSCWVSETVLV